MLLKSDKQYVKRGFIVSYEAYWMITGEILAEKHSFNTGFARYFDSELE